MWIYIKLVVYRDTILQIVGGKFENEDEKVEYEEILKLIDQIEKQTNITALNQEMRVKLVETLKVLLNIQECFGYQFTTLTIKRKYMILIKEVKKLERLRDDNKISGE